MAALNFATFNVPTGDGVGTALLTNTLGPERSIVVDGGGMSGFLVLQGSCDDVNFEDVPGLRFDGASQSVVSALGCFSSMRVRREQTRPEVTAQPTVGIGAPAAESFTVSGAPVPPIDGIGAPVDLSSAGNFVTAVLSGITSGFIILEGSQEASGDNFAPFLAFGSNDDTPQRVGTFQGTFSRVRVRRIQSSGGEPSLTLTSTTGTPSGLSFGGPMFNLGAAGQIRYDNANYVELVNGALIPVNASAGNGFFLTLGAANTFEKPTNPREGQKITFRVTLGVAGLVPVWESGLDGFRFAAIASPQGIKLADVNALFTATPINGTVYVGFEYHLADQAWNCIGLAGWFIT